jgi:NADH dehydrogenase [ubiquinone] 1 alpha subcomplex assembly factor 1
MRNGIKPWKVLVLLLCTYGVKAEAKDMKLNHTTKPTVVLQPEQQNWRSVNDTVMGGVSSGNIRITDDGKAVFSGTLSLDNNGGFSSVRHDAKPFGLAASSGVKFRIKGDGNTYQFRVQMSDRFDGVSYKADFKTKTGQWQDILIPWTEFVATYRGRLIRDAGPLNSNQILQIGFLLSEKQVGNFQLEIASIEGYSYPRPF